MVDIASPVIGLPATFISCVQCFEIVQYGRNLEDDQGHLVDRLHHIGVKLSRWGESRGLLNGNLESASDQEGCQKSFMRILSRFQEAQERGQKYELKQSKSETSTENGNTLELEDEGKIGPAFKSFRNGMKGFMNKYATESRNAGLRVRWAIYERQVLLNLVNNLRSDVDDLVELFPEHVVTSEQELIVREMQEVADDAIPVVQFVNKEEKLVCNNELETLLEKAVIAEIERREQQGRPIHRFENFDITEVTDAHVGNKIATGSEAEKMGSVFKTFKVSGAKGLHIGHEYRVGSRKMADREKNGQRDETLEKDVSTDKE